MTTSTRPVPPDGITDEHERPIGGWRHHASPLSLVVFGVVLALAAGGVLGHERDWRAEANGAVLVVHTSEVIRNGEFAEMRVTVSSDDPIGDLGIAVAQSLWEDMTVNTMIPAATEERSSNGEFRFVFGPIEAGATFLLKVDLQVNPDTFGGNDGIVAVYDGERLLVEAPISIAVLP
jgi:hypothetical protein